MNNDLIRRSNVLALGRYNYATDDDIISAGAVRKIPAVDAVERCVYEQVAWERDTAIAQLSDIGKGLGAKMDDAVKVVRCRECIHRPTVSDHDEIGGFKYEFPDERCPCRCEDEWYSWMPDNNWFCGNGQRRERW